MNLDFTISTPDERINYIIPQLSQLNPTQLEYAADYILRADKFPIDAKQSYWQRKQPEAIEDSCLDTTQFQPIARNTYTKPKQKISPTQWQLPALAPLNADLIALKAKLAQLQPNTVPLRGNSGFHPSGGGWNPSFIVSRLRIFHSDRFHARNKT